MNFSSGKKNKEPYILIDKNFNPKDACKKLTELARTKDGEADTSGDTADVEADSTTILPPIHASPSRLALHNQKDDDRNMEYRTCATETENTKSHPKMSFYKLILIMNIIVILLAVFIIFKLVLGR
ncbi:unnamed protein product [Bemisia tabaci]|uniref:Uncharacterized protein n=1 Tax=Bemisia tabaci TaxID=7038 RepID=A0A9P0AG00_BEMTA|nr:unnamed protein product [Bemisia tabaci]